MGIKKNRKNQMDYRQRKHVRKSPETKRVMGLRESKVNFTIAEPKDENFSQRAKSIEEVY